jgi:hypothetical protein
MTLLFPQMGGCPEPTGVCNSTNCFGHEVDLMQFELSLAIPGRLYGGNLADSINGTGQDRYNLLFTTRKYFVIVFVFVFAELFIFSKVFDWFIFQVHKFSVLILALEV